MAMFFIVFIRKLFLGSNLQQRNKIGFLRRPASELASAFSHIFSIRIYRASFRSMIPVPAELLSDAKLLNR